MNEITLRDLQVSYDLPKITFDVAPLKEQVDTVTKQFKDWVVIEQDIAGAKDISAALNNTAKAINDKRIAIVKEIKAPIDEFENKLKSLTQQLKDTAQGIKTQIDTFIEAEKEHKRQIILTDMGWADYMTFDEKWLNKGTQRKDIEKEIEAQKMIFQANVQVVLAKCETYGLDTSKYLLKLAQKTDVQTVVELIKNDYEVKKAYVAPTVETPIEKVDVKAVDDEFNFVLEIVTTPQKLEEIKKYLSDQSVKFKEL